MKNWREWIGRVVVEVIILIIVGLWTISVSSKLKDYETIEHADRTYVKKEVQDEVNKARERQLMIIMNSLDRIEKKLDDHMIKRK